MAKSKSNDIFNSLAPPEKDDEKMLFNDQEQILNEKISRSVEESKEFWKVLIVDDEEDIHSVTRIALKGFTYKDKGIQFLHTYSANKSKSVIRKNPDIAVILLDVVMETNTAGLDLVKYIRDEAGNKFAQIILRTGYPGYAPEKEVIVSYDINDYKTKTELTAFKLFTLMLASLRAYDSVNSLEKLRQGLEEKVKERTREIELKNESIMQGIQYASLIQNAMLPSSGLFRNYFSDYFILTKPKEIVSGDFYWVTHVEGKLIFTIADCTGHGVPGAFMSILGIMLLDQITGVDKVSQADEILNILRDRVNMAIHREDNRNEMKDGLDLTLGVFDPMNKTLQFSGAFSRIYQIRNDSLLKIEANQIPWTSYKDYEMLFEKYEVNILPGDVLYLFTDGYPDQFGGAQNKKFTIKRFQELLMSIYHQNMNQQMKILDDTIIKWQGTSEQIDDITVLGMKY